MQVVQYYTIQYYIQGTLISPILPEQDLKGSKHLILHDSAYVYLVQQVHVLYSLHLLYI